jgi:transcriptional antiterminator NusG
MPYYALHVKTGSENDYLTRSKTFIKNGDARIIWLRRSLKIRSKGEWMESLAPIFPGYLFLDVNEISPELFLKFKQIPGFYRFLQSNENIVPLSNSDRELVSYFLSFGEIVKKSTVYFDIGNKIRVLSGPLKELEGKIIKVDRRKGRAKVRLDMFKQSFLIDLAFEAFENEPIDQSR